MSKNLKRAHLADFFFSVKNLPEIKYHVCVIVSRRRDLALTAVINDYLLMSLATNAFAN